MSGTDCRVQLLQIAYCLRSLEKFWKYKNVLQRMKIVVTHTRPVISEINMSIKLQILNVGIHDI